MLRLSLKNIWSRKGRLLLTAIAVIAGTAFLSGVFVFTDTIKGSFNQMFADAYAGTDAVVRSSNVIEGQFGEEARDRISDSLVEVVRTLPGVAEAQGDVQSAATMTTAEGKVVGQDGPPKFGGVFSGSPASPFQLVEGHGPTNGTEVVIDRGSAKHSDIAVGDQVTVTTIGAPREFTVSGIVTFAGNDSSGGATWALFDLATAQEFVIGKPGLLDSIMVRGDDAESQDALAHRIEAELADPEIEVLTGQEITEENQSAVESSLGFITIFLSVFALISMFVGSFIIYNVFSISAAQRQQENALLRAIGASRSQVTRSLFVEALVVGIGGSLLGCVGGVLLASTILKIMTRLGFGPNDTSLVIGTTGFVITVIVGVVVTLLCAIAPAVRSGRVPPLAAMRDVSIDHADVSRRRLWIGGVLLVVAATCVALGLTSDPLWLGPGVIALFIGLIALGPLVAGPVARWSTPVLSRTRGASGTVAGRNAARNPKRTALTAGALGVGLSLLIGVATLGASAKESIREVIGRTFNGDYTITPDQSNGGIGLPPTLADDVNALGIGEALGISASQFKLFEKGEFADKVTLAVDAAQAAKIMQIDFVEGGFETLTPQGILYSVDKAKRDRLSVGDTVDVQFLDGSGATLTLQGIFDSATVGNLIVDRAAFDGTGTPLFDLGVFVQRSPDVSEADATAALEDLVATYPTAKLQTRDEYINEQADQIDTFLNFIYALLGMSIFIAVLGIVVTLLLAVYERRRELGLVRAVGMTRRQVRSSVLWESIVTALVGAVMGTVLGLALGWIVVTAFRDQGLEAFKVPVTAIVIFVVLAVVVASIAAAWPARRASKADILQAIATT